MWIVVFLLLVFGLVAYTSRKQGVDYDTNFYGPTISQDRPDDVMTQLTPKTPTFEDDPYLKVFLFLQDVFTLYLVDQATLEEKKQVKRVIKNMETESMKVIETFSFDKRTFQDESLIHARTLIAQKDKVFVHHGIFEKRTQANTWKVMLSALARGMEQEFSEAFLPQPSFATISLSGSIKAIDPLFLV